MSLLTVGVSRVFGFVSQFASDSKSEHIFPGGEVIVGIEDAKKFVKDMFRNDSMREALTNRLDVSEQDELEPDDLRKTMAEHVPQFAEEQGYDFTAEEGFEALESTIAKMESEELSDAELEQVAGGKSQWEKQRIGLSVGSVGVGCALVSVIAAGSAGGQSCEDEFS